MTADLLRDRGLHVLEAVDGQAARDLLTRRRVDVIVTDHWMPRLTGRELIEQLRAAGDRTPVVLVSALSEAAGGLDHVIVLRKPCSERDLVSAIEAAVALGEELARDGAAPATTAVVVGWLRPTEDAARELASQSLALLPVLDDGIPPAAARAIAAAANIATATTHLLTNSRDHQLHTLSMLVAVCRRAGRRRKKPDALACCDTA